MKAFLISTFALVVLFTVKVNANKPDIKIDVKKNYDKDGNLISYDSTYSYSYSYKGSLDSIPTNILNFNNFFHSFSNDSQNKSFSNIPSFDDFFKAQDSLLFDFFNSWPNFIDEERHTLSQPNQ